jgi:DNA-binding beta-propeller fold protein YncE
MKRRYWAVVAALAMIAAPAKCQDQALLKLVQTIKLPADVKGNFDHFAIDLATNRLFATPEAYKAVLVFDLKNAKLIHKITGIEKPHAILFREDLKRLYVTDGEAGDVKIVDSDTYKILSIIKLLEDSDSIGYDPVTKLLYVDNGGGDVHQTYSMLSVVDTTAGKKVTDIKVDGDTLEAMILDKSSPRIFLNNKDKSRVDVIDREKRTLITSWPITLAKTNVAMAYDEANHRLFIACRSGGIVVMDSQTGKEISVLPITKNVDDAVFDPVHKRLYASCDGDVSVYEQSSPDSYKLLGKVPTGSMARTALLVPQLNRYFVAVPQHGTSNAEIQIFEVQ